MPDKVLIIIFIVSLLLGGVFLFKESLLDYFFTDLQFMLAGGRYSYYEHSENVVIIKIDEYSENKMGILLDEKEWRRLDPALLKILHENGAQVVGYDIQFSGKETEWDEELSRGFREYGPVITSQEWNGSTHPVLKESLYGVASASVRSVYGLPRTVYKFPAGKEVMAFSFKVASAYLSKSGLSFEAVERESFDINFRYPVSYFPVYSYVDVLHSHEGFLANQEETPLDIFQGKIVLIAKEYTKKDRIALPNSLGQAHFGGLVHAYAVETLLQKSFLRKFTPWENLLFFIIGLSLLMLIYLKAGKWIRLSVLFLFFPLSYSLVTLFFSQWNLLINYSSLFTGGIILLAGSTIYRRRLFMKNFTIIQKELKRLEQYNKLLEKAGQMRDILTDTIVHDIKNSIAAVEGSLIYVAEKYKEDKFTLQTFNAANIACQDIINLSSNLLDIGKMEEGSQEVQIENCPLEKIQEIISRYAQYPLFREKNIGITVEEPDFPFRLLADVYLLEQIIHNLLNNGLKYTPTGGKISVSFEAAQEEVIITFFNSGLPISDMQKEIIFKKYIRLGKGRSKYSKGLGLYFCKMAMELHKGRIWVDTCPDGNLFRLGFPTHVSVY